MTFRSSLSQLLSSQTFINSDLNVVLKHHGLQGVIYRVSHRSLRIEFGALRNNCETRSEKVRIKVRVAGFLSEETTCSRGVPQESVLGPLLFTLYIRALPEIARVPCLMFSDDILLFSSSADPLTSSQELTHAVTNVYNWLDDRACK